MKKILGDLYRRMKLNRNRLSDPIYQSEKLFDQGGSWPGDFQGRDILALTSLYHAFDGYKQMQDDILMQLKNIFDHIEDNLNEFGYFGEPFNDLFVDEQQVSGNSWFLRGLIEYYKISKEEKYLKQVKSIVENYLLQIAPYYLRYPDNNRRFGGVGGSLDGNVFNGWKVSTDVGCAFIMLDGITAAYELLKDQRLKELIIAIIEEFLKIDYINLECQTHATLSCARAILNFYKIVKEKKYLEYAKNIFKEYIVRGMTYDYSNINWFKRSNTWTEPCCIVDSLILSKELFLITKEDTYIDLFNRIYTNSIRTFQRDNGGAGCSTCAIDDKYELQSYLYEAYFCCTMRLGDGFKYISDFCCFKEDDCYVVPFSLKQEYEDEDIHFILDNEFYLNNNIINLKVIKPYSPKKIKIRLPLNFYARDYVAENGWIYLPLDKEGEITIKLNSKINREKNMLFFGDMMLTLKKQKMDNEIIIDDKPYSFIYDNSQFSENELQFKVQYVK